MVDLKTDAAVDAMREAGRVVAHALTAVRDAAAERFLARHLGGRAEE